MGKEKRLKQEGGDRTSWCDWFTELGENRKRKGRENRTSRVMALKKSATENSLRVNNNIGTIRLEKTHLPPGKKTRKTSKALSVIRVKTG